MVNLAQHPVFNASLYQTIEPWCEVGLPKEVQVVSREAASSSRELRQENGEGEDRKDLQREA